LVHCFDISVGFAGHVAGLFEKMLNGLEAHYERHPGRASHGRVRTDYSQPFFPASHDEPSSLGKSLATE
jgi:hypothetical protein